MPQFLLLPWSPQGPWIHLSPGFVGEDPGGEEALRISWLYSSAA